MKIKIGENIKKFRKEKDLTQDKLAMLLNISSAAVSKWESNDSYPDILMLFPLANIFGVTIDELMGYDEERVEDEIKEVLSKFLSFYYSGEIEESIKIIKEARKKYPNDYRIMNKYLWHLTGGSADNDPDLLMKNYDEIMQIINTILDGCLDHSIRLEAINYKAKLFHASKDTKSALEILKDFPSWYMTTGQKTEQLFAKNTEDFQYWVRKNMYELGIFTSDKIIKTIWYADGLNIEDRIKKAEEYIDYLTQFSQKDGFEYFLAFARQACGVLVGRLTLVKYDIDKIIYFIDKQLNIAAKLTKVLNNDKVLNEFYNEYSKDGSYLKGVIADFKNSSFPTHVMLRENKKFLEILEKYSNE